MSAHVTRVGTVVGAGGEPLSGARVVFEMNDAEVTGADVPKPVEITTGSGGTFSATLVPFRTYRVLIAKDGIGKGEVTLKPMCGVCLKFVLSREGAQTEN